MEETIGDLRKRIIASFEKVLLIVSPNMEALSDIIENKEKILLELKCFGEELCYFKTVINDHKEVKNGNVLNALMESDMLVNGGKGELDRFKKLLERTDREKVLEEFQSGFAGLKMRQATLVKFLETEAKVEIKK